MEKHPGVITAPKVDRKSNFELLRIVSMLLIIASHWGWWSSSYPNLLQDPFQLKFHAYFRSFGQVGVMLFILISSYFMCRNQFKTASLIKLLVQIISTVVLILAVFFVRGYLQTGTVPALTLLALTDWFIPISTGRWWFVSCYVMLFLFSPFLNRLIAQLKKHEFRLLLAVLFVFLSVIPSFFLLANPADVVQNFGGFVFIYLIGAYIRLYEEDFQNKLLCFGGAILSFVIFTEGKKNGFLDYRHHMHVIALSVFLFLSFTHINIKSKFINLCAKTTFGVYLIHENSVVRFWIWNDIFAIQDHANTARFIPVSIVSVFVVFIACAIVEYLRMLCVEPLLTKAIRLPSVNRWLAAIDEKMPANTVRAEEGAKRNAVPAIVLLSACALYYACRMLEIYLQQTVAYKLFLLFAIAIIAAVAVAKKLLKSKKNAEPA